MPHTLADQRAASYTRLENNSEFYPPAEIDDATNEALRVLQLIAPHTFRKEGVGSVANQVVYDVPDSVFLTQRIFVGGRRVQRIRLFNLCEAHRGWLKARTADPGKVLYWAPMGLRSFVLCPSLSVSDVSIECEGIADFDTITGDAAALPIGSAFESMLADYAGYSLMTVEPGLPFKQASALYPEFLRNLREMRIWHSFKNPQYFVEQGDVEVQQ